MVLLIVMPFHAALVTILGAQLPYKLLLQSWKELLSIVVVGLSCIIYFRDRTSFHFDIINYLVVAIIVLSLLISLIFQPNTTGLLAGIKTNLVVLALFLAVQPIANYFTTIKIKKLILIPALLVAIIAIFQPVLFTADFLIQLGYGVDSIEPNQFIEASQSSLRVFSTLGGPNQLGTYLIIPFAISLAFAYKTKKLWYFLLALLFVAACYMTYSRSAWIGLAVTFMTVTILQLKVRLQIIFAILALFVTLIGGYVLTTTNYCNVPIVKSFIHGDCYRGEVGGSDAMRLRAMNEGISQSLSHPFGQGLGSSGPASFYAPEPKIFESWYLQIAVEIGLLGLLLYLSFFILLAVEFYRTKQKDLRPMSQALIATILGVAVASLFLHSLADSTLGIILFILLGMQKSLIHKETKL